MEFTFGNITKYAYNLALVNNGIQRINGDVSLSFSPQKLIIKSSVGESAKFDYNFKYTQGWEVNYCLKKNETINNINNELKLIFCVSVFSIVNLDSHL